MPPRFEPCLSDARSGSALADLADHSAPPGLRATLDEAKAAYRAATARQGVRFFCKLRTKNAQPQSVC
jgi:hypothetical protein